MAQSGSKESLEMCCVILPGACRVLGAGGNAVAGEQDVSAL